MASVKCGNCRELHGSVAEVKACYASVAVPPSSPQPKVQEVPEWAKNPATERQVSYLRSLIESRDWSARLTESQKDSDISETCMNVLDGKTIGKVEASAAIERLKDLPYTAKSKDDNAWPNVPAGRYALESEDGVRFYKVDKPTEGRWAGYVFVKMLVGSPGTWQEYAQRGAQATTILAAIDSMGARESAVLFGMKARHCGRCMSPLSTPQSRAAGYGQTCAETLGWPYPSKSEALRILRERGEDAA